MKWNKTLHSLEDNELFGVPLAACVDMVKLVSMVESLWGLLDDIDTASDMFKPRDLAGYEAFYKYAMRKAEERVKQLHSDGYKLYLPKETTESDQNQTKGCHESGNVAPTIEG